MWGVQASLVTALTSLGREAARIVLPSWCAVCGGDLPWRDRTTSCCARCWSALPRITSVKCESCALPIAGDEAAKCIACQLDPLPLEWCDAWGHYRGGLERLLHAFKFGKHDFLDAALASLLVETLRERSFDAVVPVPMSRKKERRRGYNQAELLARAVAKKIDVRCEMLLTKTSDTQAQSLLPREERAANVRRAFHASAKASGKTLLLIDDICTTGETLRACANELLRAGASRVCAITVAKAS
jgi:ComF family protein